MSNNKELKLQLFDYLSLKLIEWYKETGNSEHEVEHNFSKLKLLKLLFFACAASIKKDGNDLLNYFDNFYAMPYGHVESDVYEQLASSSSFSFLKNTVQIKSQVLPQIESEIAKLIDESVQKLREQNEEIIGYDAMQLVELSHSWESWKTMYDYARALNKYSMPIPTELIRNEPKFFNLN